MAIPGDNPIRRAEDDGLGRAPIARAFARQVLALDTTEGAVVGVLGAWGSGKTSFINLARNDLEDAGIPILDFNPWMFSGAEQLVESFFVELASQLRIRPGLADVGTGLEEYGETFSGMAWLPLVGPWIERGRGAAKILGKILQRRKEGVVERRAKLAKTLAALGKPIVVVLDDIDRLSTSEIRHVFKLVRLTASFPNVIYIVAFDRVRVEEALAETAVPGRDYLEKILQVAADLPAVPGNVLNQQILAAVDSVVAKIEKPGPFDEQLWPDVFMEIIRPLIRNMRDVRRYAVAINSTVDVLKGQIALADVLALEAVRLFLPDVFGRLHAALEGLTATSSHSYGGSSDPPRLKGQIDDLMHAAGNRDTVVRAMIRRLFPAGERHLGGVYYGGTWELRWLSERRVAHEQVLRLYLERVVGEGMQAFAYAEQAWTYLADRDGLDVYLRSLDPARLQDVITSLEAFEEKFASEHVVPATIVLLNLIPDLPKRQRGMFELDTRLVVARVTFRLLRSLGDPAAVEAAVRKILPELRSLSGKLELLTEVGYNEHAGHKLVPEAAADELQKAWRDEVRFASADDLASEWDLLRVLLIAKREAAPQEAPLNIGDSSQLALALLRSARSEVLSNTMGSRAVRRSERLAWEVLIELYGDEATLGERIESLRATRTKGSDDLLDLADKYLTGRQSNDLAGE